MFFTPSTLKCSKSRIGACSNDSISNMAEAEVEFKASKMAANIFHVTFRSSRKRIFGFYSMLIRDVRNFCTINEFSEEFASKIKQQVPLTMTEWDEIREKYTKRGEKFNDSNFGARVMGLCISENNFVTADSLIKYMRRKDLKFTAPILSRFLRVCGDNLDYSGEERILQIYSQLREISPTLDPTQVEHVICGLSRTRAWKKCKDLLDEVKIVSRPGNLCYHLISSAAFKNDDVDEGVSLLYEMDKFKLPPSTRVLQSWLELCDEDDDLDKFLDYICTMRFSIPEQIGKELKFRLENKQNDKWTGDFVDISNNGVCTRCSTTLEKMNITHDNLITLRDAILQHEDYLKTSSGVLEHFKQFLSKNNSYDLILDGWSVLSRTDYYKNAKRLYNLIHQLVEVDRKRILLINYKEMTMWPDKFRRYIFKNSIHYLTKTRLNNDALIFCALMFNDCHRFGTKIASNNFMSEKRFKFQDNCLDFLLQKMKCSYELKIEFTEFGEIQLKPHVIFNPYVQRNDNFIHIPCTDKIGPTFCKEFPQKWLCLSKTESNKLIPSKQIKRKSKIYLYSK